MTVQAILNVKGTDVVSVAPGERVDGAVATMIRHGIGAVLIRDAAGAMLGILSERDVMRGIARDGADCLRRPVDALATRDVISARPEDGIAHIMGLMTRNRFRHLPVMKDGLVCGMISIGDVVKHRLAEVETEARALREYVATG